MRREYTRRRWWRSLRGWARGRMWGPYSVIGEDVVVGRDAVIHAHVVLYAGVRVGSRFTAHAHAVVREHCRLGNDVVLQNGAVIGGDGFGFARLPGGGWEKIVQRRPGGAGGTGWRCKRMRAWTGRRLGRTRVKRGG